MLFHCILWHWFCLVPSLKGSKHVQLKIDLHKKKMIFFVDPKKKKKKKILPGRVAQSVTCLVTDAKLTADPGVASSIPAWSHTFVEIDHEIISTVILLSSAESS